MKIFRRTAIYAMSMERDNAKIRVKGFSDVLPEHIIKCVVYGNTTNDLHHWVCVELCGFLSIVNDITVRPHNKKLKLKDIDIKFSRRNYDNIQTKSQVLVSMLNNPKIHPELAYQHCGLFVDPSSAYLQSKAWWEEQKKLEEQEALAYVDSLRGAAHEESVQ